MNKLFLASLSLVLLLSGCNNAMKVGETRIVTPSNPPITTWTSPEFGMYPAGYTVRGYTNGATLDLVFTLYNDLDFPTDAQIVITLPSSNSLGNNKGYESWAQCTDYCFLNSNNTTVPANGYKDINIRIAVPESVNSNPSKWMFYVAYQNVGHQWGSYITTIGHNFVFYPAGFEYSVTDNLQSFTWTTWGNSPQLMIRRQYTNPPRTITDGTQIYLSTGDQIILPWKDPTSGMILQRQYTQYSFTDNQALTNNGNDKLFYRAWLQHLVNGKWDGTWDAIGQSLVIPEVQAKVLIVMS